VGGGERIYRYAGDVRSLDGRVGETFSTRIDTRPVRLGMRSVSCSRGLCRSASTSSTRLSSWARTMPGSAPSTSSPSAGRPGGDDDGADPPACDKQQRRPHGPIPSATGPNGYACAAKQLDLRLVGT